MMRARRFARFAALLALGALALGACRGPAPPVSYYALNPLEAPALARPATPLSLGVGPLELPRALDRPHIVTRVGENQMAISEFHRWAGSLSGDLLGTLARDLSTLLGSDQVLAHPWGHFLDPDLRIPVDVLRCDGRLGQGVELEASWALVPRGSRQALLVRTSRVSEPAAGPAYADLVAAHSRALAALAREIAAEVLRLPAPLPATKK